MQVKSGVHVIPRRRLILPITLFIILLFVVMSINLKLGSPTISWGELLAIIFSNSGEDVPRMVVWEMRMPRIVLGFLVGTILGAAGTLMQGTMNNNLAGPELLGVSSGASLAMASIMVLHLPLSVHVYPIVCLVGGLIGGLCVVLSARGSHGTVGMLLIGMSVTAILNGLLIILIALGTSNDVNLLYTYLLGSLANRNWDHVIRILPWSIIVLPITFYFTRAINLFRLGDEVASGLGLKVQQTRVIILVLCAGLVAITVAQCGPIGYIALIAPHLIRSTLNTQDARLLLPLSALCGGILLVSADMIARLLYYPMEIPVGVWTTLLGGGFFLLYFLKRSGGNANAY